MAYQTMYVDYSVSFNSDFEIDRHIFVLTVGSAVRAMEETLLPMMEGITCTECRLTLGMMVASEGSLWISVPVRLFFYGSSIPFLASAFGGMRAPHDDCKKS